VGRPNKGGRRGNSSVAAALPTRPADKKRVSTEPPCYSRRKECDTIGVQYKATRAKGNQASDHGQGRGKERRPDQKW